MVNRTGTFNPILSPMSGRSSKRGGPRSLSAFGPYVPATSGGATYGALRLGAENASALFAAGTVGGQYLAVQSNVFGSGGYCRAVQVPLPNMPTSGDCWTGIFFRTPAFATGNSSLQTLLAVQGQTTVSGNGGCVQWVDPGNYFGTGLGEEISSVAGFVQIARNANNGAWHLWGATNAGSTTTPTTLGPILVDTEYLLIVGISGGNGTMTLVNVANGAAASVSSTLSGSRLAVPMFNQIGAVGTATTTVAANGFGGSVSDVFYAVNTFPTTTQAQAIASGLAPISGISGLSYWNTLDGSTISGASLAAQTGSAATLIGANLMGSAPIRRPSAITINRLGAHWVFPLATGAASGMAWIEGTAPAGAVVNGQLVYVGAGTSAVVQGIANSSGQYAIAIISPAPKPFYRKVSAANGDASNTVTDFDVMDVGIVAHVFGQSECDRLSVSNSTMTTSPPTPVATGNAGMTLAMSGSYAGPWASYIDLINHSSGGYGSIRADSAKVRPEIMLGWGSPGDGLTAAAAAAVARTGYSCMFVYLTRSGHNIDSALLDGQTFGPKTITLTGSGPFTGTLALASADVNAKFGTTGYILYSGFLNGVRPGSVTLTWANGGSPVTVTDSGYTYVLYSSAVPTGTFAGPGFTGTINYFTGAISFTGTLPTGTLTATWAIKQETQDASYLVKTANINGFGVRESFDRVGSVGLRYGASFIWTFWITANAGDTSTPSIQAANLAAKYSLLRCMAYGLAVPGGGNPWPGYLGAGLALGASVAAPPMVIAPKGRETASTYAHIYAAPDVVRQAQSALWPSGSSPLSFSLQGSWYYDDQVEVATSPHEDHSVQGAQRIGRRMAADIQAAISGSSAYVDAPTWGAPVFSGGSVGARTAITIPLSAAWVARNPTLTLTVASGGTSAALDEWYVGGTSNYTGSSSAAGTLVDNNTYATAALGSGNLSVVIAAAGSTTWVGTELVRYVIGAPGTTAQAPPQSLLYDNRGGFGANEPGLLASPKFT